MNNVISIEKARLYEQYRLPYAREAVDNLLVLFWAANVLAVTANRFLSFLLAWLSM